jgi:hypothetical protein
LNWTARTFGLLTRRQWELLRFKPKGLVIVEQGTPQVVFTTLVLQLYRAHNLTVATMDALVDRYWRGRSST